MKITTFKMVHLITIPYEAKLCKFLYFTIVNLQDNSLTAQLLNTSLYILNGSDTSKVLKSNAVTVYLQII